jgi:hypothetical protein
MKLTARAVVALGLAALLAAPASAADWGTIKGRVVYDGAAPVLEKVKVDADPAVCDKCNVYHEKIVVDPKSKGIRWAVVWIIPEGDGKLAINPAAEPKEAKVFIDQPCCQFEPRVLCIRAGKQKLSIKNSAPMAHNIKIDGGNKNPNLNQTVAAGNTLDLDDEWKPATAAVPFGCTIHKWMKGYIRVFDHPYFAVTNAQGEFEIKNAPAGKCRLVIWQEEKGWVVPEKEPTKTGVPIEIKKDATTDLGEFKLKLS